MNTKRFLNAVRCLSLVMFLVMCITSARTEAASYQKRDGTIVDPILDTNGDVHTYSGPNLWRGANLVDANLEGADLFNANLATAFLELVNLTGADLTNTHLTGADLLGVRSGGITGDPFSLPTDWQLTQGYLIGPEAHLRFANLTGADLTGATFTGVQDLATARGNGITDE